MWAHEPGTLNMINPVDDFTLQAKEGHEGSLRTLASLITGNAREGKDVVCDPDPRKGG